jgi:hypothetical protein
LKFLAVSIFLMSVALTFSFFSFRFNSKQEPTRITCLTLGPLLIEVCSQSSDP